MPMSGALGVLQMKEGVLRFLAAGAHGGGTNLESQVEQCFHKRKSAGVSVTDLKRAPEQLLLVAPAPWPSRTL